MFHLLLLILDYLLLLPMKCRTQKNFFQQKAQISFYNKFYKEYMMYGSPREQAYRQSYPHSALTPRAGYALPNPRPETPTRDDSESWACDFCKIATFRTYEEACSHERTCSHNTSFVSHNSPWNRSHSNNSRSLLLSMPSDKQSLSDRQCYVRSQFVEIFEATEADVSARHSKGAQKLRVGQIGIRCMHCLHHSNKNRAERATCFPSSISRIYQTVADMQRFHFEACRAIPQTMKLAYKSLKTTRPRGQGSPQSYWIESAKKMGLIDTDEGIRLAKDENRKLVGEQRAAPHGALTSKVSSVPQRKRILSPSSLVDGNRLAPLPPLSPEGSQSSRTTQTTQSSSHQDQTAGFSASERSRNEDANMLLALRGASVSIDTDVSN